MSIATHTLTPDMMAEMLDVMSDAVIVIDEQQNIVYFNQGSEIIFGYRGHEVIGQPLAILLPLRFLESHHLHVQSFAVSNSISRPMGERRELVGRRKTGEEFPAVASIVKLSKNTSAINLGQCGYHRVQPAASLSMKPMTLPLPALFSPRATLVLMCAHV